MARLAGYVCFDQRPLAADLLERMAASFNLPALQTATVQLEGQGGARFGLAVAEAGASEAEVRDSITVSEDGSVRFLDGPALDPARPSSPPERAALRDALAESWRRDPAGFCASLRDAYAGVCFDPRRATATLFRDRFGVRSLYYAFEDGLILFASEIKALFAYDELPVAVEPMMLGRYLSMNYRMWFGREMTFFQGVRELPLAAQATLSGEGLAAHRYWAPPDSVLSDAAPDEEYVDAYRGRLDRAVGSALENSSDRLFLVSGGLDSPVVAAKASQLLGERVDCCAAVFPGDSRFDESRYIDVLTEQIGAEVELVNLGPEQFLDRYLSLLARYDQPLITPTYVLFHELSERASQSGYRSLFGGGGGDTSSYGTLEFQPYVLADYRRYGEATFRRELEAWCRRVGPYLRYWPGEPGPLTDLIDRLTDPDRPGVIRNNPDWIQVDPGAFGPALAGIDVVPPEIGVRCGTYRQSRMAEELFHQGAGVHSVEDINGASLEIASFDPLWDLELIEFGFQLPVRMLTRDGWTKRIVREGLEGVLPEALRTRSDKTGLGLPVSDWLREGPVSDALADLLNGSEVDDGGLIDAEATRSALKDHRSRRADHGDQLWKAFALLNWARRWLGSRAPVA